MGGRGLAAAVIGAGAAVVAAVVLTGSPAHVVAAGSQSIAYVFDSGDFAGVATGGTGTCADLTTKTCRIGISDPLLPGGSIFTDALGTGTALGTGDTGSYTAGGATYSFTNVQLKQLDATPSLLSAYDTVVLYQVCSIGATANSAALTAVNTYLDGGGKVVVMDADRCSESRTPDYSKFAFPFTSNNPGAAGAVGRYLTVEASTLTTGLSTSYVDSAGTRDAVGDANVFVTFSGAWCAGITAKNENTTGIVEAYARTAAGGLAIFEGEDVNFTYGANSHLTQVFDDILAQPHNPDGLPCTTSASGITLTPPSQTVAGGATASLTATIVDVAGKPQDAVAVTFTDQSGPDAGKTLSGTTGVDGKASASYTPAGAGTDTWVASFKDIGANVHTSNTATVIVTSPASPTPTPTPTPTASVKAIVTAPNTGGATPDAPTPGPAAWGVAAGVLAIAAGLSRRRRRID